MKYLNNKNKYLLIIICLLADISPSSAQLITISGEQIYISPGTEVYIEGDWKNSDAGGNKPEIVNEGTIILTGNWVATPNTQYSGNGTFELSGKGNQTLPGMDFYNLVVSGSGYKILTSDATVNNSLVIENGRINTALHRATITLSTDATISETPTSYVTGYLKTTRNLSKNEIYYFGGMGFELQATLQDPGLTTLIRATGDSVIQGSFGTQSIKRYFDLIPENSGELGAKITFRYADDELNGLRETNLALFQSPDNGKTWQNKGFNSRDLTNKFFDLPVDINVSRWTLGDANKSVSLNVQEEKNAGEFKLHIFPNPATEYLIIENNSSKNFTLNLININGQILKQDNFINRTKLNLEDISAGVYFLQMKDESGRIYNEKLVVLDH